MADTIKWVEVVSADGEPLEGFGQPVPSHWLGTDLLPAGAKKKGRSSSSSSKEPSADDVPAKSENRDVLEAYAVKSAGISEEDAKAFANKDELHDAIVRAKSGS